MDGRVSCHWFWSNLRFPSFSNQHFLSYQSEFWLWSIFAFLLYPCCVHRFTEKERANELLSNSSPLFPFSFQQGNFTSTVRKPLTQSVGGRLARLSWSCDGRWLTTELLHTAPCSPSELLFLINLLTGFVTLGYKPYLGPRRKMAASLSKCQSSAVVCCEHSRHWRLDILIAVKWETARQSGSNNTPVSNYWMHLKCNANL